MSTDVDLRADQTEAPLKFPPDWEIQPVKMTVETRRHWIPLSETTASLLAAVLAHRGMTTEAWIAEHALADGAALPTGSATR